jgi:hypothetical protein
MQSIWPTGLCAGPAADGEQLLSNRSADLRRASSNEADAPEAAIFEPQNLRQSAVAFYMGG